MQEAARRSRHLGLVWVRCSRSMLALGLERMLGAQALVYSGHEPPKGSTPSCIIYSPDGEEVGPGTASVITSGIQRLRKLYPEVPVLLLSLSSNALLARTALQAGARGFIHTGMLPGQIARAISVAQRGEIVVPREVLSALVVSKEPADLSPLSPRQREVLELVAQGLSNAEIGKRLYLSESTVKQHLRKIYRLVGVSNRIEASNLLRHEVQ
jgi:DNA-binding CsgD family transcriptional regulator